MGPLHKRLQIVALSSLLIPSGIGVVAVHASPTCERIVRTYVTVPVRNRVSKTTAIAWEKWRVGHPNWKPNPRVTRPKYVMTRKEAMHKVEVACEVGVDPATLNMALTPDEVERPPEMGDLLPMSVGRIEFPDVVPEQVALLTPQESPLYSPVAYAPFAPGGIGGIPGVPSVPPVIPTGPNPTGPITTGTSTPPPGDGPPVVIAATPEPSSLLLMISGLAGVWMCWARRGRLVANRVAA